jgi:leucyl-tRNA synthetase
MFIGPWDQGGPWDARGIQGVVRWLTDVWDLALPGAPGAGSAGDPEVDERLRKATHRTIARVSADLEAFGFNTAIAALMELRNTLKEVRGSTGAAAWTEAVEALLKLTAPFAPHLAEELWCRRGLPYSIHDQGWPEADPTLLAESALEIAVQVNGKLRERLTVAADAPEGAVTAAALETAAVTRELGGRAPRRVIYVPGRLVNVVI